jgi:hypothetical protein
MIRGISAVSASSTIWRAGGEQVPRFLLWPCERLPALTIDA